MTSGLQALSIGELARLTSAELQGDADLAGVGGVSIDSRTTRSGEVFFAIVGPRYDGHDFVGDAVARGALAVVASREIPKPPVPLLRVGSTTRALQDVARHVRTSSGVRLVAITGSTGKTTTKEMTAALLRSHGPLLKSTGNLNNEYGLPLTLLGLEPEHRLAVVELGMSAAGELRTLTTIARPDIAVITNVAAVHLANFATERAIAEAKAEILEGLSDDGIAVLNHDDPELRRIGTRHEGRVIWFGRHRDCDVSAERWRGTIFGMRFELRVAGQSAEVALPLAGQHHTLNFLAAAAAAHALGVDPGRMAEAALEMTAPPQRGRVQRLGQGVTLLDDSYNSNPRAVEAAVRALGLAPAGRRVAFLGDMLELGPAAAARHAETAASVAGSLDVMVGVGAHAGDLREGAERTRDDTEHHAFEDAAAAAASACDIVQAGDAVLVKGSRGVRMESVVEALVAHFGRLGE